VQPEVTYLRTLELCNFKRFYGQHSIDLMPVEGETKPLILIGGDNGRGKTSIHEAINYALYVDDELPGIQTRPSYLRAVSDRLNRRALDEAQTDFGVAIELLLRTAVGSREIRIERTWVVDPRDREATSFEVRILEDGRELEYVDEHSYREFIRRLCPSQIAPFFFFDGERIQELAEDVGEDHSMVEAIEDILHISVYKQLRSDLRKYVVEHLERQEIEPNKADDYYDLLQHEERMQVELDEKRDRLSDVDREIEELERNRQQIRAELQRIAGSPYASDRQELAATSARLEGELEAVSEEIRTGFADLPILLAGELLQATVAHLEQEAREISTPERLDELRRQVQEIEGRVFMSPVPVPPEDVRLSPAQQVHYVERFRCAAADVFQLESEDLPALLHDVGSQVRQHIVSRARDSAARATRLRAAVDGREALEGEKRETDKKLMSIGDDPHVDELIQEKQSVDERLGALQEEKRTLAADTKELEDKHKIRCRQIEDRRSQRRATTLARCQVKLAQQVRRALDEFIQQLGERKLEMLAGYLEEMYKQLRKPENPVVDLEIDPQSWRVILRDEDGRPLEKRVFSAGMKEIYALSLLWALGRASGHKLPVVIDTPLGRLDSQNRGALCRHHFPHAGHQVVLLSTDQEIDRRWFEMLRPYVSRQYCLENDSETGSTVVRPGYFF